MSLHRLLPLYDRARLSNESLVLATVVRTGGSTYAKPGAQMLIASDGEYAGLLVRWMSRRRPSRTCARSGCHRQGTYRQLRSAHLHGSALRPRLRVRRRDGHPAVASIGARTLAAARRHGGGLSQRTDAAVCIRGREQQSGISARGLLPGERQRRGGSAGRRTVRRRGNPASAPAVVRWRAGCAPGRHARGLSRLAHHGGGSSRRLSSSGTLSARDDTARSACRRHRRRHHARRIIPPRSS